MHMHISRYSCYSLRIQIRTISIQFQRFQIPTVPAYRAVCKCLNVATYGITYNQMLNYLRAVQGVPKKSPL
jgi:thiamine biosynthesis protein ThiC